MCQAIVFGTQKLYQAAGTKIQMDCTRTKNHGVIRDGGEWKRNRGYVMTPVRTISGELDT